MDDGLIFPYLQLRARAEPGVLRETPFGGSTDRPGSRLATW
jgi:hypothetical protein